MTRPAYYNEFEPEAAQTLRNLIAAGHIAPGDVDERSIKDVHPDDLRSYTQCHFFAGIGVWSYALRRAGWPDDRPVWTGSCPCQPFSTAGKGEGLDDPRHLWPTWLALIRERRPVDVLGEQVSGKDGIAWLDLTRADLEDHSYSTGALVACSAGVGGADIRQRLYWVGHAHGDGSGRDGGTVLGAQGGTSVRAVGNGAQPTGTTRRMADANGERFDGLDLQLLERGSFAPVLEIAGRGGIGRLALADEGQRGPRGTASIGASGAHAEPARRGVAGSLDDSGRPGPLNGFWRAADWLFCTDGKWRPVEPGTFPLATGAPARVGRLRAYGNAINAEVARVFIECVMEVIEA